MTAVENIQKRSRERIEQSTFCSSLCKEPTLSRFCYIIIQLESSHNPLAFAWFSGNLIKMHLTFSHSARNKHGMLQLCSFVTSCRP